MPVVEGGRRDHPLQRTQPPAHIGVDQEAPHGQDQHEQRGHHAARGGERGGQPENVNRDQTAQPGEHIVDRVSAGADQKIHLSRVMVDRMEAPKKRNFVRPAMAPIKADLAHHQSPERARPDRPARDRRLDAPRHDDVCAESHQRQRRGQQQRGHQAADEVKADIAGEALAEDFSSAHRAQAFQGQEDHGQQQQPRPKPDRAEQERVKMLVV